MKTYCWNNTPTKFPIALDTTATVGKTVTNFILHTSTPVKVKQSLGGVATCLKLHGEQEQIMSSWYLWWVVIWLVSQCDKVWSHRVWWNKRYTYSHQIPDKISLEYTAYSNPQWIFNCSKDAFNITSQHLI